MSAQIATSACLHCLARFAFSDLPIVMEAEASEAPPAAEAPIHKTVSPRQLSVLKEIARGQANKQIARTLGISDQTVKNHITHAMERMGVSDRTQAVVYALRHHWIEFPTE